MKPLRLFCLTLYSLGCFVTAAQGQSAPSPAEIDESDTIPMSRLERIEITGQLRVGIREDAVPFGYREVDNQLRGMCLDFFKLLEQTIIETTGREYLSVHLFKSSLFDRFSLVSSNTIDLECGPNTITDQPREQIAFSHPFFVTGTQFLVRQADAGKLRLRSSLADVNIGVMKGSTTEAYIIERYPNANIKRFQGITGRIRGVQAVRQGKLDAFVSDGILLRGEAELQQMLAENYPLIPANPITCDRYGMILPADDKPWHAVVNQTIARPEFQQILVSWFQDIVPYLEATGNPCQDTSPLPESETLETLELQPASLDRSTSLDN